MIGHTVAHYQITEKLGEGGMGIVYKARDTHLDRFVAIKVLPPERVADPARKARFVQEAKAASALNHPNIVHAYDISSDGGVDFIAMEYVAGKTLDQLISHKGMRLSEALKIAVQIADALARAHSAGIVHRDLKPANVMVAEHGLVKVLDFGLAKLMEQGLSEDSRTATIGVRTEEGTIVGTVAYMSPEQAEGRQVDARSDIFSFGSLLYEMVTGQRAFQGDSNLAVLSAILRDEPQPMRSTSERAPAELETIVHRCLRKDPERRFQHVADVKVALAELREDSEERSASSRPTARWDRGQRWRARSLRLVVGAVMIAMAVALGAVFGLPGRVGDWLGIHRTAAQGLIAVLPFSYDGGDSTERVYADGLAENLTRKLTLLEQFQRSLLVAPVRDVRYRGVRNASEARSYLGVKTVVTGAVQRAGDRARVTLTLVDGSTGRDLKPSAIDADDAGELQYGAALRLAKMLGLRLSSPAERVLMMGSTQSREALELYLRALGHLQNVGQARDLDQAIELFQRATEKDPSYADAHAGLGEAYAAKANLTKALNLSDKAQQSCRTAIQLEPRLPSARIVAGQIHAARGRWKEAVEEYRTALEINPASGEARVALAKAFQGSGQLADAESTLRELIRVRSVYWASYVQLGVFYTQTARYREAVQPFQQAIKLAPSNDSAFRNLGAVYHYLGRFEEAEETMKKALAARPTSTDYGNLGTLYWFLGRYADAVPLMEKAAETDPRKHLTWGNLADAYRRTPERAAEAPRAYQKAVELAEPELALNPENAELRASLAWYCLGARQKRRALEEITKARRQAPTNEKVLYKAALVYEQCGQRERAISVLDLALRGGYSWEEARRSADLAELLKDPRWEQRDASRSAGKRP